MTQEQLKALMAWIDAQIDVKIEEAFNRDSLHESMRERELRSDLGKAFGLPPNHL